MSATWKPVPKISASTSISRPSAGTTECSRTSSDAVGVQLDVVARERRIPVVGGQDALAADGVVGRRLRDQRGVAQPALAVLVADLLDQLHALRLLDEAEHHQLAGGVNAAAQRSLQRRNPAEHGRSNCVTGRPLCGMTHGGVRWKTCSCSTSGAIAGTYWIADAPVPIDARRACRFRSASWSQRAEWNTGPGEALEPGEVRDLGLDERARRRRRAPWRSPAPGSCRSASAAPASSHSAPRTSVFERILLATPKSVGDALEVRADLGLARIRARPVRVGRERERVQVRRARRRRSPDTCCSATCRRRPSRARARRSPRCPARAGGSPARSPRSRCRRSRSRRP